MQGIYAKTFSLFHCVGNAPTLVYSLCGQCPKLWAMPHNLQLGLFFITRYCDTSLHHMLCYTWLVS